MDEYIYAGKGWEPKIGDKCEARSSRGVFEGWIICEIVEQPANIIREEGYEYCVHLPTQPARLNSKNIWNANKTDLRKHCPPEQKDSNQSEFTFDELINDLNK